MKASQKSNYTYHIIEKNETEIDVSILLIIDLDLGRVSVTNNVEAVVSEIAQETGRTDLYDNPIIYKDSQGAYGMVDGASLQNGKDSITGIRTAADNLSVLNTLFTYKRKNENNQKNRCVHYFIYDDRNVLQHSALQRRIPYDKTSRTGATLARI